MDLTYRFRGLFWHFSVFRVSSHRFQQPSFPIRYGLLRFRCVLFWPMCTAWRTSQHSGGVNVSSTWLLMRPETKERADTIIGSVLRGSFTFYQATAGDMRGEMEAGRAGETKMQQLKRVLGLQTPLWERYDLTGRFKPQLIFVLFYLQPD